MRISLKLKRLIPTALLLALVLAGVFVGTSLARTEEKVLILSVPRLADEPRYVDKNGDGHATGKNEFIGNFDVYDGSKELIVAWEPFTFPAGVDGSYRVSIVQVDPLTGKEIENKQAHHWATNEDWMRFAFGSFGFGTPWCATCPTYVRVIPEQVERVYDEKTKQHVYKYTDLKNAPIFISRKVVVEVYQVCEQFVQVCTHNTSQYQPYFVPIGACVCGCTLTNAICQEKFGLATADTLSCTCR